MAREMSQNCDRSWYQLSSADVLERLESAPEGLSQDLSQRRLEEFGYNELKIQTPSAWKRLLRQFHNALIYILLIAITLTAILGMWMDMAVILGVVALNVVIGYIQEGKAEGALDALKRTLVAKCTVIRSGEATIIPSRELVPGEIVSLSGGDRIPADLRLISAHDFHADESALTGESVPAKKEIDAIDRPDLSPGDQRCMAFSSTFATRGSALGIVVETAEQTEIGKIAVLMKEIQAPLTPLQSKIADFTRTLIIAILLIGLLNLLLGHYVGYALGYNFLGSISLIVAAIPEMLPMIVTGILALSATRMAQRSALIRRLPAAETLGCTTVICSDKTGTLTKNEMTVQAILCADSSYEVHGVGYDPDGFFAKDQAAIDLTELPSALRETLRTGLLCNDANLVKEGTHHHIVGDPTEGALLVAAAKAQITDHSERIDEIPFDSENMYMATLHRGEKSNHIFVKGSPEQVLKLCTHQLTQNGPEDLTPDAIHEQAEQLAAKALRLLAMATKAVPHTHTRITSKDLHTLTFLGIEGMIDPPRPEAIAAIEDCKQAGIRPVMITGDHAITASAVARQLGILSRDAPPAIGGETLARMSDDDLREAVARVSVFARVAPEHKLRIARQLQERGEIVAMTGDGVNDAPALKAADIGIAMGITGTEVSKEAADMVLTDDNFASIVGAVEEGRHAWKNLEKAILYTLPTNGGQAMLVIGAVLMATFVPIFAARLTLEPVMILWINLFDSVFLTMPLMMEAKERNLLKQPPRPPKAKLASMLLLGRVILIGLAIALPGFWIYHHFGAAAVAADGTILDELLLTQAQTAAFWAVLMVHFGFVMSARSIDQSAFSFSPFSNKWLLAGIAASVLLRLLPSVVPSIAAAFRTANFPLEWWLYILPCLLPGFIILEIEKLIRRRFSKGHC
ncbi:Cation-transporting ATPase [Lentimonas sp. CC4]|nr:Cation-transporting ATPase [Lentimonas sp. CC4]CAA6686426.1 Cation-transporting ATPase [Lentimonas sp. CC6]CAA7074702.1 Cation-transporting ATPase [Lentimonas sp. CC4]CAA7169326.1 Cation-transporting ATPase [Lentimonas sp. CC21]CAA7180280.1 Cation-transporting ATPase [Lentimonas sp. CC8]